MKPITARIITVGSELVTGLTVDTNAAYIARALTRAGVTVAEKVSVPDHVPAVARALKSGRAHVTIVSGGLGPTTDDLTREALAKAFNAPLKQDPAQVRRITRFFRKINRPLAACNLNQAMVPKGFRAVNNPRGTAPMLVRERPFVFAVPGVPREAQKLMEEKIIPAVRRKYRLKPLRHLEIRTSGIGESSLQDLLGDLTPPKGTDLAFLPDLSGVTLRLSGRDKKTLSRFAARLKRRCGRFVYGASGDTLELALYRLFFRKKLTLAVAESCTGGLVASKLVSVPGSSAYFNAGTVTYSNRAKKLFLGVPQRILTRHGAVSAETALAMARGLQKKTGARVTLAITGIAGPSGGTKAKPVGTVYIAVAAKGRAEARHFRFFGDREAVRERAAYAGMEMVRKKVIELF
jgi:nicotinamide-nucleotide amidase